MCHSWFVEDNVDNWGKICKEHDHTMQESVWAVDIDDIPATTTKIKEKNQN